MATETELLVKGKKVRVTNLEKVFYPVAGFTKGDVINYYVQIAEVLLPHLKNRAVTLKRYPNGVEGEFFYEKTCPVHRPAWVKTQDVWSEERDDAINYCLLGDLPTMVWLANLANLEIHSFLAKAKTPERPTVMVFDLDPGAPADIVQCCQVGLWLRAALSALGLKSFAKTSGSKGLQVYVPLNMATSFEATKTLSHALAQTIEREHSKAVVSRMQKELRRGKVLIDWSQNDDHKTTVSVYSLRAKTRPTVSTPVEWGEVERCLKKRDAKVLTFDTVDVLKRVSRLGDLFSPVLSMKQKLPKLG